ncbi:MAG: trypsin-like serine protease [Pseudomonadota bacterium]|nr:trypsin-like serine protease [Pseudomonadota bacterium]
MISRLTRSLLFFAMAFSALGLASPVAALVVRHDVPAAAYLGRESDFPAVFGLYRTHTGHWDCLATLIGPRHALTAAHCTDVSELQAQLGTGKGGYAVEIAGLQVRIEAVIQYQVSGADPAPDLALLRLERSVTHIQPIGLLRDGNEVGRVVQIPGWGGTGTGQTGAGPSDGLFRVAENRVDRAENGRLYWTFDDPAQGKALTLEGISGPGDSGGPALVRTPRGWSIAGVSSAQRTMDGPEGVYGVEEVFVRVSDFVDWIQTELANSGK